MPASRRVGRQGRCYRCLYVWSVRGRANPSVCPRCKSRLWRVPKIKPVVLGNGLGVEEVVGDRRETLLRMARRYGARKVWVFGSVRRREARPDSDLDLLVDWKTVRHGGSAYRLASEARHLLGRRVQVASRHALAWYAAPRIVSEAIPL